ncbi:hypothetical protein KO02_00140 [Sphingobacterium sp. ML3W]|uniref:FecR family protein n=1 Tax=Sphingobacterium sp. ML3W TaxID=1538644 RepID=UPI0004F76B9F|nr:FecR domain-containing protein [Sphingobacterium sp. ML3W]AIM35252.1 hypothetical protein KO02_00140 [Sphingobacterium sp. ML3W]
MNRPSEEMLIRFFRGQCPPDEEKAVKIYLAMNTDKEYVEACLRMAFPDLFGEHDPNITQGELDRLWNKLEAKQQAYPIKRIPHKRWYAYAAAVAFLVMSSVVLFLFKGKTTNMDSTELAWNEMRAGAGNIRTVKLADSSTVILFPGSVLSIAADFNKTDRQVKLLGRAFFQVNHNRAKPFYVSAQGLTTRVLGTSFEINASTIAAENIITLHSGKISVSHIGKEIAQLTPDQQIRFSTKTGQFNVSPVHAVGTIGWLNGELDYDQTSLGTIIYDLEKWYGINIRTSNPLILRQKVTISFKDLQVTSVLNMLSKSANFGYTIKDKQVMIKERGMERD